MSNLYPSGFRAPGGSSSVPHAIFNYDERSEFMHTAALKALARQSSLKVLIESEGTLTSTTIEFSKINVQEKLYEGKSILQGTISRTDPLYKSLEGKITLELYCSTEKKNEESSSSTKPVLQITMRELLERQGGAPVLTESSFEEYFHHRLKTESFILDTSTGKRRWDRLSVPDALMEVTACLERVHERVHTLNDSFEAIAPAKGAYTEEESKTLFLHNKQKELAALGESLLALEEKRQKLEKQGDKTRRIITVVGTLTLNGLFFPSWYSRASAIRTTTRYALIATGHEIKALQREKEGLLKVCYNDEALESAWQQERKEHLARCEAKGRAKKNVEEAQDLLKETITLHQKLKAYPSEKWQDSVYIKWEEIAENFLSITAAHFLQEQQKSASPVKEKR